MGVRIHSAKKYDVEWNSYGAFNNSREELYYLLKDNNIEVYCNDDMYSDSWEIDAEQLDNFIATTDNEYLKNELEELVKGAAIDQYGYYQFLWF